jgi:hypothetical protein
MIFLPKSQPAPDCLAHEKTKAEGDYKCGSVLNRLAGDFKNKCYLCEDKTATSINIEHFIAHQGDKNLKFDWTNLFYACGHCNNIKLAKYNRLLNCTTDADIEAKIRYDIKPFPKELPQILAIDNTANTCHTVTLLLAIFNGTTPLKKLESANLRNKLLKEVHSFQSILMQYFDYADAELIEEANALLPQIKLHIGKAANFASFKRCIIRNNNAFLAEFGHYL